MEKILIEVSGGVLVSVWFRPSDVDILIIDHDIDGADKEEVDAYNNLLETATEFKKELVQVY